jgi:predicted nucleic acid-binding protein
VKYLLDVNALIALTVADHAFHKRVLYWADAVQKQSAAALLTCPISELGLIRVLAQGYGMTIEVSRDALLRLKRSRSSAFAFVADDHDAERLPAWVKTGGQITDGHLLELAGANGAQLATLDEGIAGAFLIPLGAPASR